MLRIGFDIGGTFIKAGLLDHDMNILAEGSIPFPGSEKLSQLPSLLEEMALDLCKSVGKTLGAVGSVGVAVPGSLDPSCQKVLKAYNLGMVDYPLKALLERKFPAQRVRLINDANGATLAECQLGALRGYKTGVLITLGTGVGGGLILGGRMFNGGLGHGVELGHMRLVHGGEKCTCGNRGCVEAYCSSAFFYRTGMEPKERMEKARQGDPESLDILRQYTDYLSDALTSVIALLDPEVIALGGGISEAGELLLEPLRQQIHLKSFFQEFPVVRGAMLGNQAGFIGAALLDSY